MAGPYEDPMQGKMPANPQGGGLPGQPRNPATGGYPSRDIAPSPLMPGQINNPDLYGRSMQNGMWQEMLRRRAMRGMTGGPGMWAEPGQPIEPDMTSKADELDQYKNNLQFQKNYGITPFMPNQRPDWMSEDRAGRIAGRIAGREPAPKGGFMPSPMPFDSGRVTYPEDPNRQLPPWAAPSPWGGMFGRTGGYAPMRPGGYGPAPGPGGPGQTAKPGAPAPGGDVTAGGDPSQWQTNRGMPAGPVPA